MMRWIKPKLMLDRGLQRLLKAYEMKVSDEEAGRVHDALMQAILRTPQELAPRRPSFGVLQPTYPAVALSVAMLILGTMVGQAVESVPVKNDQVVKVEATKVVDQKEAVLAMASPWGDWIEEGE